MHPLSTNYRGLDFDDLSEANKIRSLIDTLHNLGTRHYRIAHSTRDRTARTDSIERSTRIYERVQAMIDFLYAEYPGTAPRPSDVGGAKP